MEGLTIEPITKLKPLIRVADEKVEKKSYLYTLGKAKVGVIPLPLYLVIALIIYSAGVYNQLPADMIGGIAVIMVMGILLGDLGMKIPVLKDIGGPAILSLLVPSILVFCNLINSAEMRVVIQLMKTSNFLYLYISILVVGSILGMNRRVLIQGFTRMFVPLIFGTLASLVVAMISSGYFIGKLMKMYPVDSAIVTGCHSGLGGTGDVAILSASNRMSLMPFAQVSTRIGGASTIILAILLMKLLS